MEFLDSLDFDTKNQKSHRVRSWYLYEQYKSLEKHQLDAAHKLLDRSYQERLLRKELSERRARRQLYDHFGACQSESRIEKNKKIAEPQSKRHSVSNNEFFESSSEKEEQSVPPDTEFDDDYSQELAINHCYDMEVFKNTNDHEETVSYSESVNSVVENLIPNEDCDEVEITRENQLITRSIAQDLNMQLDALQQNIKCLESITKLQDIDKSSDNDSLCLPNNCRLMKDELDENRQTKYNNVIFIWSRLVSYAYQMVQLNRGNCYCDYSSQFLTAVLACDVLRRGVNRMCSNLQPYVSPIKLATEDSDASDCCFKNVKTKKSAQSRKSRKTFEKKLFRRCKRSDMCSRHVLKNDSDNTWQNCYRRRSSLETRTPRRASETIHGTAKHPSREMSTSSSSTIWPHISKHNVSQNMFKGCRCSKQAVNPMLEIARYIDNILKDTKDL